MKALTELHLFIVEDEDFSRSLIRRIAEMIGIPNISEATDGADALSKLETSTPDVIILDIMMEPMNGLKFLKFLRMGMTGAPKDLPVIVLTGSEEQAVVGKSIVLDCNAFIKKPIPNQSALEARLKRVLLEPIDLKDSASYQAVSIPDVMPKTRELGSSPNDTLTPSKAFQTPLEEILPGSIIARDVLLESGDLLISEGSVVNAATLNRMRDLSEIIGIPEIWIRS